MLGRDWECISFMDEISIVPRSSDPVDKSKSTWLLRFWSMLGKDDWQQRCNDNLGRSSGRIQCVLLVTKNCWESMEKQFHSSGTFFSQDFRHCRFFKGAKMFCDARNCIREEFQNKVWLFSAISRIYKATKIAMQAKVSFRWSMTIWFTNWFLCIKQRRLRMQKLQWTRNGKSSRQFHHVNWKEVMSKKEVVLEAQRNKRKVHVATLMDLSMSLQECGVITQITKIQRQSRAPWWHCKRRLWSLRSFVDRARLRSKWVP